MNQSRTSWRRPGHDARSRQLGKLLALLPGFAVSSWILGPGLLRNLLVAVTAGYLFASLARLLRRQPLRGVYTDIGVPTTAALLALLMPPEIPLAPGCRCGLCARAWSTRYLAAPSRPCCIRQ